MMIFIFVIFATIKLGGTQSTGELDYVCILYIVDHIGLY